MSVKVKIKVDNKAGYLQLPAVALRGLVIFPSGIVHFDVGREKSVNAVNAAMAGDRMIYLVPQSNYAADDPKKEDIFGIGVVGQIKQTLKVQDGIIKVMVDTRYRAKTIDIMDDGRQL